MKTELQILKRTALDSRKPFAKPTRVPSGIIEGESEKDLFPAANEGQLANVERREVDGEHNVREALSDRGARAHVGLRPGDDPKAHQGRPGCYKNTSRSQQGAYNLQHSRIRRASDTHASPQQRLVAAAGE